MGKEALDAGDRARALKFLTKARRLDPTRPIDKSLISSCLHRRANHDRKTNQQKKNYYEILGLKKTCCVEDVRKAYQTPSLKVHPDKNKAPVAEEAFKAVSKAFQCLRNEESRKTYDLVGSDESVYETRASAYRGGGGNGFNGFYDHSIKN